MKPSTRRILTTAVMFLYLATVGQKAHAVVPAPDGCYPNYTTAEGCSALIFLTTGIGNTAIGWYSLFAVNDGSFNTGVGAGALAVNGAWNNTAVGAGAMLLNGSGAADVAVGTNALLYNVGGSANNAVGAFALYNNVTGNLNNAFGTYALSENILGSANTAIGDAALTNNDITANNTAWYNTAVGASALFSNTDGDSNTAVGNMALFSNETGFSNTAFGAGALANLSTGNNNVALGTSAGSFLTTGSFNIYINNDGLGVGNESHTIRIGTPGLDGPTYIAGIHGTIVSGGAAVLVSADGQLGTSTSSERFKEDIQPMDNASEAVFALKPVTFHYKKELDPNSTSQFGLVAEDVERVNPDLVARDRDGKPYTVRYEAVNAMLLNEFLKEHRKNEKQEATIADLKGEIATLSVMVKEQAAQIQKVSAQMQMSQAAAAVVANQP
jgi:trimeric autotransporter adhesin